jgi:hypothetical protein
MVLRRITNAYRIIRWTGLGFCVFRSIYALRKKFGLLKRKFPVTQWPQVSIENWLWKGLKARPEDFLEKHKTNGRRFFFTSSNLPELRADWKEQVIQEADAIVQNKFRYFFDKNYDLGPGPNWFLNPETGKRVRSDIHWCDIDLFDPDVGDIKFIWEPSRFAWVYTLVRAYSATRKEKYAEKFWELFESWLDANQPNMGPNYTCGQECAIRLMAMCFALYGLLDADVSTVERGIKLIVAIAIHSKRIESNIDFAVSTHTNHSLTEAAALYTTGLLFPEFERSEHWMRLGKRILIKEGLRQIYPDGSYIQHSMNYHRLMLQDFLWVMRIAQLNGDSFCAELSSRVAKAAEFLYQMQDENSGRVPNYGPNDGALIIPLNSCDYLDYRPVLQAAYYLLNGTKLYTEGPWDEDMLWFFGVNSLTAKPQELKRKSIAYESGGYYTIRNKDGWAMMRCHSYRNRPGHSDMLHLDLWWNGHNILRDSGTYMYNCEEPWQSFFSSTVAHNTVVVNNSDQMERLSRFMWSDWTKSKLMAHKSYQQGSVQLMQGEHYSYCRRKGKIIHRRAVLSLGERCWIVVDDIVGGGTSRIELCWHLCDARFELKDNLLILQTRSGPVGITIFNSSGTGKCKCFEGADRPMGWESIYYGNRRPSPVLVYSESSELPNRLVTIVGLGDAVKDAVLREGNTALSISGISGQDRIIGLNSIGDCDRNIFTYILQGDEKVLLD